jgi:hypothetical protein
LALRTATVTGIANGLPFYAAVLDRPYLGTREFDEDAVVTLDRGMFRQAAEMFFPGRPLPEGELEPNVSDEHPLFLGRGAFLKMKAYSAWLITHAAFRTELANFRNSHPEFVGDRTTSLYDRWEGVDIRASGEGPRFADAVLEFKQLLRRWSLNAIAAWEVPIPTELATSVDTTNAEAWPEAEGLLLRVPYWMLQHENLKLPSLDQLEGLGMPVSHLKWTENRANFGDLRWARLLELYIYREKAIAVRYPEQHARRGNDVARAFTEFWTNEEGHEVTVDSFAKIETRMKQRVARFEDS